MGDMLLATVFPLVMRKAFGSGAGRAALAINLGAVVALITLSVLGMLGVLFPVMIVLGPLTLAQYAYWRRRGGRERTTRQYLAEDPRAKPVSGSA